jgi:predicted nuclease of restriction endonuclease-like (RecB) superfamily
MSEELSLYQPFLNEIMEQIHSARYKMIRAVSKETVELYWSIGRIVSEKVQIEKWGMSIVEKLSKDLQSEFSGLRGFSARNIWRMKTFYEVYAEKPKLTPLVAEIGWVQNCIIIEKCKNDIEKEFYIKQIQSKGWSKNDLLEKIEQNYFANMLLAQNNFDDTVDDSIKSKVAWEFIDDYNIELLNPDLPIHEKEIENSVVVNIVKFLQDMGGNFAFVGRQYRIEYNDKEYFIDLLFFNLSLNCYVVFELKAREFAPQDLGQLQMYMMLVNKEVKQEFHNLTIGIVVCRGKDRTIVEYLLSETKQPMGVATFNKHKNLPESVAKYLPSEDEISRRLFNFENQ